MIPKRGETANLLVPVCFSASHVAYSSLRMEREYMIIGQAAGVVAAMSIRANTALQDVDTLRLTRKLIEQGAVMEYHPARPTPPSIRTFFKQLTTDIRYSPEFFQ